MKKHSKLILIVLVLALTFALFSGFTYVDTSYNADTQSAITSHDIKPNAPNDVININTGDTLRFNFDYSGPIYKVFVNNQAYGNFVFSSAYGQSVLDIDGLANGTYKVSFQTKYSSNDCYDYSVVVVVGTDPIAPPVITTATVKYFRDTEVISAVTSSYESNFDTQLTNLPTSTVKDGYRFISWAYWNNTTSEWVNFDTTNMPMVTENMLMNGVFKVAPIYKEIQEIELTYYLQEDGFLWFDNWEEFYTVTVEEGAFVPDVSHKFGVGFNQMTFDEKGNTPITASSTVDTTRTDVYVHLHEIDGVKVKYMSGYQGIGDPYGDFGYGVFEYDYSTSGSNFNVKVAPPIVLKTFTDIITYDFLYWSTDKGGDDRIEADAIVTENVTVYAQYENLKAETGIKLFFSTIGNFFKWADNISGINNLWLSVPLTAILSACAVAFVGGAIYCAIAWILGKLARIFK